MSGTTWTPRCALELAGRQRLFILFASTRQGILEHVSSLRGADCTGMMLPLAITMMKVFLLHATRCP